MHLNKICPGNLTVIVWLWNVFEFLYSTACNYAKGRWVADKRRPLYSGLGCKQWLSDMWACRLTQRPDFSYEGYRWQPENCKMPDFEGTQALKRCAPFLSVLFIFISKFNCQHNFECLSVQVLECFPNCLRNLSIWLGPLVYLHLILSCEPISDPAVIAQKLQLLNEKYC